MEPQITNKQLVERIFRKLDENTIIMKKQVQRLLSDGNLPEFSDDDYNETYSVLVALWKNAIDLTYLSIGDTRLIQNIKTEAEKIEKQL